MGLDNTSSNGCTHRHPVGIFNKILGTDLVKNRHCRALRLRVTQSASTNSSVSPPLGKSDHVKVKSSLLASTEVSCSVVSEERKHSGLT